MIDQVQFIEELAANAWPALVNQHVDGWRFRFQYDVTRRANSVLPNGLGNLSLEDKLNLAESFYRHKSLPSRFQICPASQPIELDEILNKRGYQATAHTCVQIAEMDYLLKQTDDCDVSRLEINDSFDDPWFDLYCPIEQFGELQHQMRKNILSRIAPATGYAQLKINDQLAAIGVGVIERGWLGVFGMFTSEKFRRQQAATQILRALAMWGQRQGVENLYLQVMKDNPAALSLYQRVGFETLYDYHYREKDHG